MSADEQTQAASDDVVAGKALAAIAVLADLVSDPEDPISVNTALTAAQAAESFARARAIVLNPHNPLS